MKGISYDEAFTNRDTLPDKDLCPMKQVPHSCDREKCMWWHIYFNRCVVYSIVDSLEKMEDK